LELLQIPIPGPERIVDFLQHRRADEGGFLEIKVGKRAGVNPTAAAIASLKLLNALDQDTVDATIEFLADSQSDEGGFCANTRIPVADLLSTFTGLLTLIDLEAADQINSRRLEHFVAQLERAEGGFHAGHFDPAHDVEYSFYGLGCRALLAGLETADRAAEDGVN
jgi:geranylgeranyl transferase type-2 subunit beta